MMKWFRISLAVELAVLFISGLAVVWYLWLGGGVSARMALGCDIAVNLFAACALAVLIELLTLKRSTREEAAKILRNDDLAHYYISRFAKLYFEMTLRTRRNSRPRARDSISRSGPEWSIFKGETCRSVPCRTCSSRLI